MKRKIKQQTFPHALQRLFEIIALLETPQEVQAFFEDLCTPAEIAAMADRWLVVPEIIAEKPYRQIHEETAVSITTIGRVARAIAYGRGGYNLLNERLQRQKCKQLTIA